MEIGLLEKLQAVQIEADSRITEKDRLFCEAHQKAYDEAKNILTELTVIWEETEKQQEEILKEVEPNRYSYTEYVRISHISSSDFTKKTEELPEQFINNIVEYFSNAYRVDIKTYKIRNFLLPPIPERGRWGSDIAAEKEYQRQLRNLHLRYQDVLEQIFLQLGGCTFTERAVQELKEKCHTAAWSSYSGTANYELKNSTIRFTYGCEYEHWYRSDRWKLIDSLKDVMRGVAHFETRAIGCYPHSISTLLGYTDLISSIHELDDCEKAKEVKMFKNKRVDIKFASSELANQFASDYLGRVG